MMSEDRFKLRRAGFRIFRKRTDGRTGSRYSIWEYEDGAWRKLQCFTTSDQMREQWHVLMAEDHHIGDE